MTDSLMALIAQQGALILFLGTFFSCLAVPVPASLMMLAGGAFVASGDLEAPAIWLASLGGALAGDQLGYGLGRRAWAWLEGRLATRPKRAALIAKARNLIDKWGGSGVFLSRWLLSPLGPFVNLTAGAAGLGWLRFTLWDAAGEVLWVSLYLGLGYGFASQLAAASQIIANLSGLLAALAVTAGLGLALRAALKAPHKKRPHI